MAVVSWPDDFHLQAEACCVVCKQKKSLTEVMIGLCDTLGHQKFACNTHFKSARQFIVGWADFTAVQTKLLATSPDGSWKK